MCLDIFIIIGPSGMEIFLITDKIINFPFLDASILLRIMLIFLSTHFDLEYVCDLLDILSIFF